MCDDRQRGWDGEKRGQIKGRTICMVAHRGGGLGGGGGKSKGCTKLKWGGGGVNKRLYSV